MGYGDSDISLVSFQSASTGMVRFHSNLDRSTIPSEYPINFQGIMDIVGEEADTWRSLDSTPQ